MAQEIDSQDPTLVEESEMGDVDSTTQNTDGTVSEPVVDPSGV